MEYRLQGTNRESSVSPRPVARFISIGDEVGDTHYVPAKFESNASHLRYIRQTDPDAQGFLAHPVADRSAKDLETVPFDVIVIPIEERDLNSESFNGLLKLVPEEKREMAAAIEFTYAGRGLKNEQTARVRLYARRS